VIIRNQGCGRAGQTVEVAHRSFVVGARVQQGKYVADLDLGDGTGRISRSPEQPRLLMSACPTSGASVLLGG
jgi:hypothetical protein